MTRNFAKLSKSVRDGKKVKRYKVSKRFNESPVTFESIDVDNWRELTPFCPFCKGENVESASTLDERPEWRGERWFCRDCQKHFAIQARVIITFEDKECSDGFTVCPLCSSDEIDTVDRGSVTDSCDVEEVACLRCGKHFGRSYKTFIEFEQETVARDC